MENREIVFKFSDSLLLPMTIMVDNKQIKSLQSFKGKEISINMGSEIKFKNFSHSKVISIGTLDDGVYYIEKEKTKWLKVLSISLFPILSVLVIESTIINLLLILLSLFSIMLELSNFVIKNSNNEVIPKPYNGIPKLTSKSLFKFAHSNRA